MFDGTNIRITMKDVRLLGGISPSLQCYMEAQSLRRIGKAEISQVYLTGIAGKLVAVSKSAELPVGSFVQDQDIRLFPEMLSTFTLTVWLDWSTVESLERLRNQGDGHLHFRSQFNQITALGWIALQAPPQSQTRDVVGPYSFQMSGSTDVRYVREDWLQALTAIGYREIRVYEGPPVDLPKEWNITHHFDKAWEVLRRGDADDAMQECRKALEGVRQALVDRKLAKLEEKEVKIDFKTITSSEVMGETLSKIWSGMWGFLTPGQHHGSTIRYADGEFAFFTTLGLVRYVSECVGRLT